MRIAYFDCFSGISGDMTLGALVAAGVPFEELKSGLDTLGLSGYDLECRTVIKKGITAIKVDVIVREKQVFRHLPQIEKIIQGSQLPERVKIDSLKVFRRLGEAEAKVHGIPLEKVHFHEVGAIDSILDIVGSVLGLHLLNIEKIYSSALNFGSGTVKTEHGVIPVPAPATVELCQGVPGYGSDIPKELVTPTGAALITTLASEFGSMPPMDVSSIGYGAANADLDIQANVLRVMVGEGSESAQKDCIVVLEANLDDLNPQAYECLIEDLLAQGALDVTLAPVQMKKNRPGITLTVLASREVVPGLETLIFNQTTTFGIRSWEAQRTILDREFQMVSTPYGNIRIKIGRLNGKIVSATPEYEDCRKLAKEKGIPLKRIQLEAMKSFSY